MGSAPHDVIVNVPSRQVGFPLSYILGGGILVAAVFGLTIVLLRSRRRSATLFYKEPYTTSVHRNSAVQSSEGDMDDPVVESATPMLTRPSQLSAEVKVDENKTSTEVQEIEVPAKTTVTQEVSGAFQR